MIQFILMNIIKILLYPYSEINMRELKNAFNIVNFRIKIKQYCLYKKY